MQNPLLKSHLTSYYKNSLENYIVDEQMGVREVLGDRGTIHYYLDNQIHYFDA